MMILFGILVIVNVSTKKAAKLTTEECEEIIDNIIQNKAISIRNKDVLPIKIILRKKLILSRNEILEKVHRK